MFIQETARIMATAAKVVIATDAAQADVAREAIADALAWLRQMEASLTRFDPASDLCQLNAAGGHWFAAPPELFTVVTASVAAAQATEGIFDPTILPALEAAGYDRDFAAISHREIAEWHTPHGIACGAWGDIELDPEGQRIRLPEGVRLDLGGIAKGWAADVAATERLRAFPNVLVSLGGDIRVCGSETDEQPWAIAIGDTRQWTSDDEPPHAAILTLGHGGLATSGSTDRWWWRGGERQHHLIDPRTGAPAALWITPEDDAGAELPRIASATALAPSAMHAEVAAKVALLRGYPRALGLVEQAWQIRDPAHIAPLSDGLTALLLLLGNGEIATTTHLAAYLWTEGKNGQLWLTPSSAC